MDNKTPQYIVATTKSWNIENYRRRFSSLPNWHLITSEDEFAKFDFEMLNPKYIFFPHWSWIVPKSITQKYDCICFHMTDLPFGRGGSPLQNLIQAGLKETKVSVLKMTNELDAGPIYFKMPLSLAGRAQDIFVRCSELCFNAMETLTKSEIIPTQQSGDATYFKRRNPEQSEISHISSLEALYDHIRMLDADGYPSAYLDVGNYRLKFSRAQMSENELTASVSVVNKNEE